MTDSGQPSDDARLTARLKELLDAISLHVDHAPSDEKQRLLTFLERWQDTDRRRAERKPCFLEVSYPIENEVFTALVRNISSGGVFIITSEPLEVGQQLPLVFSLPGWDAPLRMTGQVVWKSPAGVGVKFTSPPGQGLMDLLTGSV